MRALLVLVAAILGVLFLNNVALNQPLRITENLRHETVLLPLSTPERSDFSQVDMLLFVEAGGGAGMLFFYDDAATKAPVDYIEFYDPEGNLLLVSWIDRLGICQAAMDRGLLDASNPRVDRTMVPIALGTAL